MVSPTPTTSFLLSLSLFFLPLSINVRADGEEAYAKYSYVGSIGPESWGSLSPKYKSCSSGKYQSPIDIVRDKAVFGKTLQPLVRRYAPANATLVNGGCAISVQFEGHTGDIAIEGKNYTLKHMHYHTPSEHQIDGEKFPAEVHLVHTAADGSFAVIGILYQYGDPDPLLAKFEDKLEEMAKESCSNDEYSVFPLGTLDTKQLRKKTRKYYRYSGSFTTPPCSENITWTILGKVRSMSKKQVELLKAPLPDSCKENCRPVQSLFERKIQLYDELSEY